jgi:sialic acid synthase SpsE
MSAVYIISELGINHNGNMDLAKKMIDLSKSCGADAVKFQTYVTDDICRKDNPEYKWLKHCELSYAQFRELQSVCKTVGIDFISTPDTVEDAEFLDTLGMRYMKIGSANAKNGLVHALAVVGIKTPLIVSLGMGAGTTWTRPPLACWMHCVSSYPCPIDQANMACIDANHTGFSDHTLGSMCATLAVARGAKFIEKHFTLDRNAEGPDHHMSMEPIEFSYYVQAIRMAERALGDGVRRVMPCEQETIEQLRARK